jgi:hypothetical protein
MLKRSWLFLLPLIGGLLWVTTSPSQGAGETWRFVSINNAGCGDGATTLTLETAGLSGDYVARTVVTSGGMTYTNEQDALSNDSSFAWGLYDDISYGDVSNKGTWPIPAGHPVRIRLDLEQPKGTVKSSWTTVFSSCEAPEILYNGPTSADLDEDLVATPTDLCPALQAFTANGCLVRERALSLRAKYGPKRVVGKLSAAGYPELYAGRTVKVWKKRPGPDRLVATRTTNSLGKFKVKVHMGRYYATSAAFASASQGEALADISYGVRVH